MQFFELKLFFYKNKCEKHAHNYYLRKIAHACSLKSTHHHNIIFLKLIQAAHSIVESPAATKEKNNSYSYYYQQLCQTNHYVQDDKYVGVYGSVVIPASWFLFHHASIFSFFSFYSMQQLVVLEDLRRFIFDIMFAHNQSKSIFLIVTTKLIEIKYCFVDNVSF